MAVILPSGRIVADSVGPQLLQAEHPPLLQALD
jgi:hypothetical protein